MYFEAVTELFQIEMRLFFRLTDTDINISIQIILLFIIVYINNNLNLLFII